MLRFSLWEELPYFHRVALTGSLRKAAADMKVSPATLSRRIKNLESAMGNQLFFRVGNHSMEMTKAGQDLFQRSAAIDRIVKDLEAPEAEAPVDIAITSIPCFASHVLIPALDRFHQTSSQKVNITIDTGFDVSELSRHPFDIALRLSRPETGRFRVQRIKEIGFSVVCGKTFKPPEDGRVPLVLWGDLSLRSSRFNTLLTDRFPDHPTAIYVSSYHMYIEALKNGLGVGILPSYTIKCWDDTIVEFKPAGEELSSLDLWLVTREDALHQPLIKTLASFISKLKLP